MMKKRIWIWTASVFAALFLLFVLMTETNLTQGLAWSTARRELRKTYPDFGTIITEDITPGFTERCIFPRYKIRTYGAVFLNERSELVTMEISAYFPFVVTDQTYDPYYGE